MALHFALASPPQSMVVLDHRAAALRLALKSKCEEEEEAETSARAGKRVRQEATASAASSSSSSGVCQDSMDLDVKPINAAAPPPTVLDVNPINAIAPPPDVLDIMPINAVAPSRQPPPPATAKELPPCLRKHVLAGLGLRADLPVHFVGEKVVTKTDVDGHQNRFRIPNAGVQRCLHAMLNLAELHAANLLYDMPPRRRTPKKPSNTKPGKEEDGVIETMKEPKHRGKVHGGLPVMLVDVDAGTKKLQLSRWDSSHGTVIKGRATSSSSASAASGWATPSRFGHSSSAPSASSASNCSKATAYSTCSSPRSTSSRFVTAFFRDAQ